MVRSFRGKPEGASMAYWADLIAASILSIAVRFALPVAAFAWLLDVLDIPWSPARRERP